jgi:hypothetical protein
MVDIEGHLLEVTGRSRHADFERAWQDHWDRMLRAECDGFYVFAADFEVWRGRLAFHS